jgi:hypothetical protein
MRVPSSSLTLRSEAPVRTHRGSGFGPLISRAMRGGAWAAPSFRVCGRRGVWASQPSRCWLVAQRMCPFFGGIDIVSSQGLVPLEGFAWYGYSWCPLYIELAPGGLLTPMSLRGLTSSGAKGSRRSRVLRGMGTRGACFTSSRSRATFSRRYPIEGCFRFEPRARAARGFYVAWVPVVPALHQAGPGRSSHVDIPSRVALVSSQGFAPLEGSPCLARDPVIKCLAVEAAVFAARARLFRRCGRARARSGRRGRWT